LRQNVSGWTAFEQDENSLDAQLNQLHDATLLVLRFEWATGTLRYRIRTADLQEPMVDVIGRGVARFDTTREEPWGPSRSIYEVTLSSEGSLMKLTIQMQSGDILVAIGRAFTLEAATEA
jgi:hypothetical protein